MIEHKQPKCDTPDTDTQSSLLTVGVVAALREFVEDIEEVLSARAKGAIGGGLAEWIGGLKGRFCKVKQRSKSQAFISYLFFLRFFVIECKKKKNPILPHHRH